MGLVFLNDLGCRCSDAAPLWLVEGMLRLWVLGVCVVLGGGGAGGASALADGSNKGHGEEAGDRVREVTMSICHKCGRADSCMRCSRKSEDE